MPKIIKFEDYPDFKPNMTPREIFRQGSFGGTYWRPIYSNITKKHYKNRHKKYPKSWWHNIPIEMMVSENCDKLRNKYNVNVGTSLDFWESKGWITKHNPYGWIEWYCGFYNGKRGSDDERQISRWKGIAGQNGRFRKWLINIIKKQNGTWNDYTISPKIRQTLLHWGYELTNKDFNK